MFACAHVCICGMFFLRCEVKISVLSWSEAFLLRGCAWMCTCFCICVCMCVCMQYVCVCVHAICVCVCACVCARVRAREWASTYVVCGLVCYPFLLFLKWSTNELRACVHVHVHVYMSAYVACFVFRYEVKISVLSWSEEFLLRGYVWMCTCLRVCVYAIRVCVCVYECSCVRASELAHKLYVCLSVTLLCPFWSKVLMRWGRVCVCMCTCLRMWHILFSGMRLKFLFFREVKSFCY